MTKLGNKRDKMELAFMRLKSHIYSLNVEGMQLYVGDIMTKLGNKRDTMELVFM